MSTLPKTISWLTRSPTVGIVDGGTHALITEPDEHPDQVVLRPEDNNNQNLAHRHEAGAHRLREQVQHEQTGVEHDRGVARQPGTDYKPFANASQFRLFDYFYGRSDVKSQDDFNDLVALLRSDGFSVDDIQDLTAKKGEKLLDDWAGSTTGVFSREDGWHTSSVFISLPKVKGSGKKEEDAPQAEVKGVIHRRLIDLITGAVTDTTTRFAHQYHWIPHLRYWIPDMPEHPQSATPHSSLPSRSRSRSRSRSHSRPHSPPPPIRIWTDCYNSNAMLNEDAKIRSMPRMPGDDLSVEYAVFPLLLWSDETHLSSFGSAYLWPIYLYFGSLSKYVRGRPTEFAAHHLAYIPQVRTFAR